MPRNPRGLVPLGLLGTLIAAGCLAPVGCTWSLDGLTSGDAPDAATSSDATADRAEDAPADAGADAASADVDADASPGIVTIDPPHHDQATTFDTTALGSLDWALWTASKTERCASCVVRIGAIASTTDTHPYMLDDRTFAYSNGAPMPSGAWRDGLYIEGTEKSVTVDVAATSAPAALTIHLITYFAGGSVTAQFVGADSPAASATIDAAPSDNLYAATIRFASAKSASLRIAWTLKTSVATTEIPNIGIMAATLAPDP